VLRVALTALAILLLYTRRPDAFINPQFWAEDGSLWYPSAYALGWATVYGAEGGYLQTLPRLVGLMSLPFPLALAPALFTAVAITCRLVPIALLLSDRLSRLIPSLWHRAAMAFLLIALPNSYEIHANMTQAVRHLAIASILVVLTPDDRRGWRVFDAVILVLTGLSAPFTILLAPVFLVQCRRRRPDVSAVLHGVAILGTAAAQLAIVFAWSWMRPHDILAARLSTFTPLLGGQVTIGALLGQRGWAAVSSGESAAACAAVATIVCVGVVVGAALRGTAELRLFLLYVFLILGASLLRPIEDARGAWIGMAGAAVGTRYWFFGMIGFLAALLTLTRTRLGRWVAIPLLAVLPIGIAADWRYPRHPNLHFRAHVRRWNAALPGEWVSIPIHPDGWKLILKKKADTRTETALDLH
jgi:hypothetical protein